MIYTANYKSPVGNILLASKDNKLIGLWIEKQKYYLSNIKDEIKQCEDNKILIETMIWLDKYFNKEKPDISEIPLSLIGNEFRKKVWEILKEIPYGETITYKEIANKLEKIMKKEKMSAQAVGGAVGHNPISIIIPCHRVVGKSGSLTGYAGGIDKKIKLLEIEGVDTSKFFIPKTYAEI